MATIARILVDEAHRQAWSMRPETAQQMNPQNPGDASLVQVAELSRTAGFEIEPLIDGFFGPSALGGVDIVVIPHAAEDEWESTTQVGSPVMTEAEMQALKRVIQRGKEQHRAIALTSGRRTKAVVLLEDDWSIVSEDGSLAAHFEHTVAITSAGPRILTAHPQVKPATSPVQEPARHAG